MAACPNHGAEVVYDPNFDAYRCVSCGHRMTGGQSRWKPHKAHQELAGRRRAKKRKKEEE